MTDDENKEFDLLQLADEMSHKNWMYFKFLYNKKFKESEDRIRELETALRKIADFELYGDYSNAYEIQPIARAALGEKKDG
jgi:hypothetical protein